MIFSGRKFIIVHKGEIGDAKLDELTELITAHGGEIVPWNDRVKTDVANKLIIVASTSNYEKHSEMSILDVPTVTEDWVHACIGEGTIVPTRPYDPDPKNFMKQVMICCSGLSEGDKDAIYSGVKAYGGEYSDHITRFTSHVIASDPDTEECRIARESKLDIMIVSPYWFDDCVRLQQYIDGTPYLLGHENSLAPVPDLTSQFSGNRDDARLAVQSSMRESLGSDLFKDRRFYLSNDLDLSSHMAMTVRYLLEINGGSVVDKLPQATVYVGRWRHSPEYVEASRTRLTVGNICWIFYMIYHRSWESPLRHLLHYPEVQHGLESMKGLQISLTNYTGNSRGFLQALVNALGATYASNLRETQTTHLICAYPEGQKYTAAKEWGIKIVNHLWLEDCYAQWRHLDEQTPRYTHFSPKLNLSHLVGKTQLIPSVLKDFYAPDKNKFTREPRQLPPRAAAQKVSKEMPAMMDKELAAMEDRKNGGPVVDDDAGVVKPTTTTTIAVASPPATKRQKVSKSRAPRTPTATSDTTTPTPTPKTNSGPAEVSRAASIDLSGVIEEPDQSTTDVSKGKSTKSTKRPKKLRVLFTGIDDPPAPKECTRLGISKVESLPAQVLVAPRPLRTVKFLCALAATESFVEPEWFKASAAAGQYVPPSDFLLEDSDLTAALARRSALIESGKKGLFEGYVFCVAPIIKSKTDAITQLVRAHYGYVAKSSKAAGALTIGGPTFPFEEFLNCISSMDASAVEALAISGNNQDEQLGQ